MQFVAQTQCTHVWISKVMDDQDTKADDTKSVTLDTTTFSKTDTIHNLWALKEEEHLELIDKLFKEEQDF